MPRDGIAGQDAGALDPLTAACPHGQGEKRYRPCLPLRQPRTRPDDPDARND